jgi:hypothetical protein
LGRVCKYEIVAIFYWTFRNRKTGRVTVAQFPNASLGIFLLASLVGRVVHLTDTPHAVVEVVAVASLGWWALDEMVRGVNPWRRLLGATVLAVLIATRVSR